jgi:2-hydroxychromene-2-carboxylate isomerase
MAHTLDFYWDFSSPFAYLGSTQADAPIATFSPAKQRYVGKDMERWAEHWGVPFKFPSRFPMNTVKALRVYLALPEERRRAYREATFRAYWADDRDISDDATLRELIGPGADEFLAKTADPAIKEALKVATDEAVQAGVFGAPTWVVDGSDLYWGQDRIVLVERALTR